MFVFRFQKRKMPILSLQASPNSTADAHAIPVAPPSSPARKSAQSEPEEESSAALSLSLSNGEDSTAAGGCGAPCAAAAAIGGGDCGSAKPPATGTPAVTITAIENTQKSVHYSLQRGGSPHINLNRLNLAAAAKRVEISNLCDPQKERSAKAAASKAISRARHSSSSSMEGESVPRRTGKKRGRPRKKIPTVTLIRTSPSSVRIRNQTEESADEEKKTLSKE